MYDITAITIDGVTKIPIYVIDNVIENQMIIELSEQWEGPIHTTDHCIWLLHS